MWQDTSFLCSAESLLCHEFDTQDMGKPFVRWHSEELWTPHGKVFDVGVATSRALERISGGSDMTKWGRCSIGLPISSLPHRELSSVATGLAPRLYWCPARNCRGRRLGFARGRYVPSTHPAPLARPVATPISLRSRDGQRRHRTHTLCCAGASRTRLQPGHRFKHLLSHWDYATRLRATPITRFQ